MGAGQELSGEVRDRARVAFCIGFHGTNAEVEHAVADAQGQGGVGIIGSGGGRHTAESAKEVVEKGVFDVLDCRASAAATGGRYFEEVWARALRRPGARGFQGSSHR